MSRPKKEARPGPKLAAVKAVMDRITEEKMKENEEARKKKEVRVCVCLSEVRFSSLHAV